MAQQRKFALKFISKTRIGRPVLYELSAGALEDRSDTAFERVQLGKGESGAMVSNRDGTRRSDQVDTQR